MVIVSFFAVLISVSTVTCEELSKVYARFCSMNLYLRLNEVNTGLIVNCSISSPTVSHTGIMNNLSPVNCSAVSPKMSEPVKFLNKKRSEIKIQAIDIIQNRKIHV